MKKNDVLSNVQILAAAMICGFKITSGFIQVTAADLRKDGHLKYSLQIWSEYYIMFTLFADNENELEAKYNEMFEEANTLFEKHKEAEKTNDCRFFYKK